MWVFQSSMTHTLIMALDKGFFDELKSRGITEIRRLYETRWSKGKLQIPITWIVLTALDEKKNQIIKCELSLGINYDKDLLHKNDLKVADAIKDVIKDFTVKEGTWT